MEHFTLKPAKYIDQPALNLFYRDFYERYENQVTDR
jgi:hypothetical protein